MILETLAVVSAAWVARRALQAAIVAGLRAPRIPHDRAPDHPGSLDGAWQAVDIEGPRGRHLFGWLVLPVGRPTAPAVLVMHGWGANAQAMWPVVPELDAAGFAVLLIDARCHGLSDDEAFTSMPRFAEDIGCALAWLRRRADIDPQRLALLGHSVGAAAALLHASRHDDVCAVVSLSAFAHPAEVMRRFMASKHVPYPLLGWYVLRHVQRVIGTTFDAIAPLHTLTRVRCPVLLVHGRGDTTVPFSDALRLQAVSSQARLLAVEGDHDLSDTPIQNARELVDFFQAAFDLPAPSANPSTGSNPPARGGAVRLASPASDFQLKASP